MARESVAPARTTAHSSQPRDKGTRLGAVLIAIAAVDRLLFVVPEVLRIMADAIEQPVVDTPSGYASVTHGGMTIESNTESADQIRESFEKPKEPVAEPVKEPPAVEVPPQPAVDETTERNEDGTYKKRNRRDDPQEAVKSAIAKQREAERERDALKAELEAARRPRQEPAQQPAPETDKPKTQAEWARYKAMPDAPKLDQFETIEDYNFAVGVFVSEKLHDAREEKRQEQAYYENIGKSWQAALANRRAKEPDFDSTLAPNMEFSAPMRHVMMTSGDLGPELLKYLSDHPDERQRILTLHPSNALEEMGTLKGYLKAQADAASSRGPAPQAPVSHAKAPIKPLGTSPIRASDEPPGDDASDEEHERYWGPRRGKLRHG